MPGEKPVSAGEKCIAGRKGIPPGDIQVYPC
jgi:hypothetical protein